MVEMLAATLAKAVAEVRAVMAGAHQRSRCVLLKMKFLHVSLTM